MKITEFNLAGTMRFVLRPLVEGSPYTRAFTFSFLKPPDLDYGALQAV